MSRMFLSLKNPANVKRHFCECQYVNRVTFFIWIFYDCWLSNAALTWSARRGSKVKSENTRTENMHEACEKHPSLYGVSARTDARLELLELRAPLAGWSRRGKACDWSLTRQSQLLRWLVHQFHREVNRAFDRECVDKWFAWRDIAIEVYEIII